MTLYVAGRIANTKDFEQKFLNGCAEVEALGHVACNPCVIHGGCGCGCWEEFMHHDIKAMLDCDGIYALRDWKASKGATIEVQLALRLGKIVIYQ